MTDFVKTNTLIEANGEPRLDTLNDLANDLKESNPKATIVKNYITNHNTTAAHTNTTADLTDEERAERVEERLSMDEKVRTEIEKLREEVREAHQERVKEDNRVAV